MPKHWTQTREGKARMKQIREARRRAKEAKLVKNYEPTTVPVDAAPVDELTGKTSFIQQAVENRDYNRGFDQGVRSALSRVLRALGDIL